jgi:hypothetical protein
MLCLLTMNRIIKHQENQFTIIINPENSSGNTTHPSTFFLEALKTLTVYPNVCVVGYIDTDYGKRENTSVFADVAAYATWSKRSNETALHGVYFDRTPWQDNKTSLAKAYLHNITAAVRDSHGWANNLPGLVVHNPGHVPEVDLMSPEKPDLVVVFDGLYGDLPAPETLAAFREESAMTRNELAMIVRNVPVELGRVGMRKMIERVKKQVEWWYVSDVQDDVGSGFPSFFEDWLDVTF